MIIVNISKKSRSINTLLLSPYFIKIIFVESSAIVICKVVFRRDGLGIKKWPRSYLRFMERHTNFICDILINREVHIFPELFKKDIGYR
uniref:Uncharacterized protein n=1 Tax=Lepeophtheirus salmonis TaxID=72036 RepID=A0A0K2TGI3_LEPSM